MVDTHERGQLGAARLLGLTEGDWVLLMFEGSVIGRARITTDIDGNLAAVIEGNITDHIPRGVITDPSPGVLIYQGRDMEGTGSP